ncbi:MAG: peroxide stress protein YaaA [Gammaproteobacteria bacterium]|nr:peroxide stress protein YaaA [Gammaproteobacteria bacterium]
MLLVISPAKKLDFDSIAQTEKHTQPDFLNESQELIDTLRPYSSEQLSKLMHLSESLSDLNYQRYHDWHTPFTPQNAKQAISTFKGDVYTGLNIESFNDQQLDFAQNHLRILSGLYGLMRPLDLMQPYRLEMGTRLENPKGKNLYEFWDTTITEAINKQLENSKSEVLINLASNEYFKSVKPKLLATPIITPNFKELRDDGSYKVIGLFAKRARGMMAAYILKNQLTNPEQIKNFNEAGYQYNDELSTAKDWIFSRDKVPGK